MTKLSRTKIELFGECPRCFWLDVKKGVKRPPGFPFTINNAIDYLLKQEFDLYRKRKKRHPVMEEHGIDAIPYDAPKLDTWRNNFQGVQHHHKPSGFLITGAVDDVWINPQDELMVVDYKATGANQHRIYGSYGRQAEVYQWLLRQNGHPVSRTSYFVFARVNKGGGFSAEGGSASRSGRSSLRDSVSMRSETLQGRMTGGGHGKAVLPFDLFIESYEGDDSWVEQAIYGAKEVLEKPKPPAAAPNCPFCAYRASAAEALDKKK